MQGYDFLNDKRFAGLEPFPEKIWLSSPTMHGEELAYVTKAYETNWMSTVGENIDQLESMAAEYIGVRRALALSSGTAALHLAVKLAAKKVYSSSTGISTPAGMGTGGALKGARVFCSDLTFSATINPVLYEGGEAVFIDTEYDTWNMEPEALERAFRLYPDVKIVVMVHLYGVPGKVDSIKDICRRYGAVLIEDAAESLGATYKGRQTGTFGDISAISFNGNKIITGSSGGMLLTDNPEDADTARKWSTQSRESAPWYQHEEIGYNYRMSNVVAGVVRGQWRYLKRHIHAKKKIYERYKLGLADLPVQINPYDTDSSQPNYWLTAMIINSEAMSTQVRGERETAWIEEEGKSCPTEILEALSCFHAEGRPVWKPMHMQPVYRKNAIVVKDEKRGFPYAGEDIFNRGLCLPSDIKMTEKEQDKIIDIIHRCFQ